MEHDALDDPFDFDASIEDALRDSTPNGNNQATKEKPQGKNTNKETIEDLGITEEITVTKKRQPIAKLDETRLLSAAGIPKLRKITKGRTKFRGKGHEYSDVSKLLAMYQLWLDELYPRAKFADGLTMIEKLGHSKHIQMMRKQWIDEGKPKLSIFDDPTTETLEERPETLGTFDDVQPPSTVTPGVPIRDIQEKDGQMDDSHNKDTEPDEDELDALWAEEAAHRPSNIGLPARIAVPKATSVREDFEDDMEAMAGVDMW